MQRWTKETTAEHLSVAQENDPAWARAKSGTGSHFTKPPNTECTGNKDIWEEQFETVTTMISAVMSLEKNVGPVKQKLAIRYRSGLTSPESRVLHDMAFL